MRVFEERAWQQFEEEMVAHSKDFSPRLCEVIGDEQLRVAGPRRNCPRTGLWIYESGSNSAVCRNDVSLW
jgi:hypothetical protein